MENGKNLLDVIEVNNTNEFYKALDMKTDKNKEIIIKEDLVINKEVLIKSNFSNGNLNMQQITIKGDEKNPAIWDEHGKSLSGIKLKVDNNSSYSKDEKLENMFLVENVKLKIENLILDGNREKRLIKSYINKDGASVEVLSCLIREGQSRLGSGIYAVGGIFIKNSAFVNNISSKNAGALALSYGFGFENVLIENSLFYNNKSHENGGAIYGGKDVIAKILSSIFIKNTSNYGGAISMESGKIIIDDSFFEKNEAKELAAAIYTNKTSTLILEKTEFKSNLSKNYGPINLGANEDQIEMNKCFFTGNCAR